MNTKKTNKILNLGKPQFHPMGEKNKDVYFLNSCPFENFVVSYLRIRAIIFLNQKPLKLIFALKEFERVLKPGGHLIITSEIPIESFDNPEDEGQWKRWNLAISIYNLKGETWSSEPLPNEIKFALKLIGFKVYAEKVFPKKKNFRYQECMNEWKRIMLRDVEKIPWSTYLKDALRKEAIKDSLLSQDDEFSALS